MIANIAWNSKDWREIEPPNRNAGSRYAQENSPHESLNFDFNKKGVDTEEHVFGYVEWRGTPRRFEEPGIIFFHTKNLENGKNEIVGVYCGARVLSEKETKTAFWKGFQDNKLVANIQAEKAKSVLFKIRLDASKYEDKYYKGERMVSRYFQYVWKQEIAEEMITDEIRGTVKSDAGFEELDKLSVIFEEITGKKCVCIPVEKDNDQKEQEELEEDSGKPISKVAEELKKLDLEEKPPEVIRRNGKEYKRYNLIIARLKQYRNYQCQICHIKIKKGNGGYYIEGAHITPKRDRGGEKTSNIMILCPNHHKEFDYGNIENMRRSKEQVRFKMNGKEYEIDLEVKSVVS